MPMSNPEAISLNDRITEELERLDPPFFGVNIIRLEDLQIFGECMAPVRVRFNEGLKGFRPHFRAMTDDGNDEKRMLVVNLYGSDLDGAELRALLADPTYISDFVAALETVNQWEFFVAREV